LVLGPGVVAGAADPEPLPADDLSRFESATVVSGLSVVVERAGGRLLAGRDTTYTISVLNRGKAPESLTIRVLVPPAMAEVSPDESGELAEGVVEWPVTVDPDAPATLHLTGAYAKPEVDQLGGGPVRVAFTACAYADRKGQPIVCATDIAELRTRSSAMVWWLGAFAFAAAGAVALFWWRRRARHAAAVPPSG
jgi:hypothetical protein